LSDHESERTTSPVSGEMFAKAYRMWLEG